jgi:hypothetical protein
MSGSPQHNAATGLSPLSPTPSIAIMAATFPVADLNWDRIQREYPFLAKTGEVQDRAPVMEWLFDHLTEPAAYNHRPGDWTRVWGRMTKRLSRRTNAIILPRRELFAFKNDHDRTLFLIRWR